jgi:integrase
VQLLTLHLHLRVLKNALDREDASEVNTGKAVFPSAGTKGRQKAFRRWVELELEIADAASGTGGAHAAHASLKALLAGAHRWTLEIYPVYLASLLAGRFSSTVLEGGRGERRRRRRRGEDDPNNVPPSVEERELRSQLHLSAVELFERMGSVGHLRDDWGRIVRPPGVAVPPHVRSAEARSWNLFLLSRALVRMLYDGDASSYSTLARWLFTGYTLLDELGGRPGWMMADGEREKLVSGFARRDKRLLELTLDSMTEEAKRYRLEALPLLSAVAASNESESSVPDENAGGVGRRARQVPTLEQIDGMARRLLNEALRPHRRKNSAAPLDVLLYMDLLAVGARKSEALNVKARHVVDAGGGSDLIIRGGKTAAAYRLVPLNEHPNRGSAERIAEAVRRVEDKHEWQGLIEAAGGIKYERYKRPEKGQVSRYFSADRLDYALRELGRRVGIDGLSPHDLRRASITACLLAGVPPELIAKYHGHEDLPTTFEHYVFGLSAVQARDLGLFLSREENQVWVAITDAVQLLNVTKVAVYKRYSPKNQKVRAVESASARGQVLERSGGPRYINAIDLAAHVRRKVKL